MSDFDPLAYSESQANDSNFDPLAYSNEVISDPKKQAKLADEPPKRVGWAEENLAGPTEIIGSTIANIPYAAAHSLSDLYHRVTGNKGAPDPEFINAIKVPLGEGGKQLLGDISGIGLPGDPKEGADINEAKDFELHGINKAVIPEVAGVAGDIANLTPVAAAGKAALGFRTAKAATAESAQEALNAAASGKSIGAASTAANITEASPELQKAIIDTTRKTGGAVNPEVLGRRLEADSLPVKMKLTEGQATQDPSIISNEMNMRGKHKELAEAYNQQNGQLVDNLRSIREATGPDVFSTNQVEHGDALIDAYKQKGAAADANVNSKYQALRDAAGGNFPVDAKKLVDDASQELHNKLLYDHAPPAVMNTLKRLADSNNMTFENFESLRTNLARIQRSAVDGNERAAAGVIRDSMERLPLQDGAAALKPIADEARSAARAHFQELEADPAYNAAMNDTVTPDKFVSKYIVNGSRDQVAKMKANLADNERASQTMGVAALDHLRDQARIDAMGNGNFASQSFNKHLDALRPKLGSLLPPEQANQLDTLGKVSRYTTAQPKGSFVNNSNTLVGALAGNSANVAESMANVAAKGFPAGTIIRKGLEGRSAANSVKRALDPASGLERLKESDK